jgi:hypothetical protein
MLVDPNYFQAVLHSLEKVKAMYQSQTELSMANEVIARMCLVSSSLALARVILIVNV